MTELDRRSFLKRSAAVTAGSALLSGPYAGLVANPAVAAGGRGRAQLNELRDVPDLRDGVVRLALPEGFQYRSFHQSDDRSPITLRDGGKMPGRHDGMASFKGHGNEVILTRNHELNGSAGAFGPASTQYDSAAPGGVTNVRVTRDGQVLDAWTGLSGTQMNCSGGPMPWGAWITCEETVNGPDIGDDFTRTPRGGVDPGPLTYISNAALKEPHGFIFEVPADGVSNAEPIRNAGRFAHEAVALDPRDGALYQTEDNFGFPSGFYKYVAPVNPMSARRIEDGGTLWMLKVKGVHQAELSTSQPTGATYDVEWVQIDEPWRNFGPLVDGKPTVSNDQAISFVSNQGLAKGAARFSRLEGAYYDRGWVYFVSTQGGPNLGTRFGYGRGKGQVWAYDPRAEQLHMLFESPSDQVLDLPDNVTTSKRGSVILCEDGPNFNFLRALTRQGKLFTIAQNKVPGRINDEFAGSTFSHSGRTLFVNVQSRTGLSFAIWGPWGRVNV